jgi:hypothetical protein
MAVDYSTVVPAGAAIASGVASAVVQSSAASPSPGMAMAVPIVSALIGGAVSYGILKGTVQAVKESHANVERDVKNINKNVLDLVGRVSNIEGRIGRRHGDPHLGHD